MHHPICALDRTPDDEAGRRKVLDDLEARVHKNHLFLKKCRQTSFLAGLQIGWDAMMVVRSELFRLHGYRAFKPYCQGRWPLILAHELGHEFHHEGFMSPYDEDPEAAADYWAGWIAQAREGHDHDVGAMFFAMLGCTGPHCAHPSPERRSRAFLDGISAKIEFSASPQAVESAPSGPSLGQIVFGALVGVVAGIAGLVSLIDSAGTTHDANVGRNRDRYGRFAR